MLREKILKKEVLLPALSILVTLIALIGISYAIFMEEETTNESIVKFGDIAMTYASSSPKIGYDSFGNPVNMYPMTQEEAIATTPYTFTLTNTGDVDLWVTIYLEKDTSFVPSGNYASYLNSDNTNVYYGIKETTGSLTSGLYSNVSATGIIKSLTIEAGTSKTFNLWTWLKSNAPNTAQGTYFVADISARGEYFSENPSWPNCLPDSDYLNCRILADNPEYTTQVVVNDTMFASAATTDEGLWIENRTGKTEDNLPVYFYRGDVENNYVSFANRMWRIVRINEDGSVKLILGGNTTTDGYGGTTPTYNPSNSLAEYVDYNHANNALRVANEDWYSNDTKGNLDVYESYIADTKFCNDKSIASTSGSEIYYGAYGRVITNKTPQYKCPNASDNYIYKIGTLTADEVAYAGGLYDTNNASYYLYDNAQSSGSEGYWWLLSPYNYDSSNATVFSVIGSLYPGTPYYGDVNFPVGFRPAVSLKSDTLILEGDGTYDFPYIIKKQEFTEEEQTYIIPATGTYKIESWGAQGASYNSTYIGGKGGYISGTVELNVGDVLTIKNGGQNGYNGGGTKSLTYNGGGATTVFKGETPLIIAAGGGGSSETSSGISGGSGNGYGGASVGNGEGQNGINGGGGSSSPINTDYENCSCPNGGTVSEEFCIGSTYGINTQDHIVYDCVNSVYVESWSYQTGNSSAPCPNGYSRSDAWFVFSSPSSLSGLACSRPEDYVFRNWYASCIWPGDYYGVGCVLRIFYGNAGNGGTSSVGTGVTQIDKIDGIREGNGMTIITLISS